MTSDSPIPRKTNDAQRLFACVISMIAMGGALWVAMRGVDCDSCGKASALVADLPLAWAGFGFYVVLAFFAMAGGFSRWTRSGFVFAAGIHAVLMGLLWKEKLFCPGCVVAGIAAILGCLASLLPKPRPTRWTAVLFVVACLMTVGGLLAARQVQRHRVENAVQPATQPSLGRVTVVLYLREGCWHCIDFEERIMTPLMKEMGDSIDVSRLDAEPAMISPTVHIIGAKGDRLFDGGTDYETMVKTIQQLR